MLGDTVDVVIEKVDALRHQIDLAVVLPDGEDDQPVNDQTVSDLPKGDLPEGDEPPFDDA
jgi:ribonuclease R